VPDPKYLENCNSEFVRKHGYAISAAGNRKRMQTRGCNYSFLAPDDGQFVG
jgi:hypothetical protein